LPAVEREIAQTTSGDRVYMVNWNFEPTLDISGKQPGSPGFRELGDLLAEKASAGVDVRIVLNGAQVLGAMGTPGYSPCWDARNDLIARRVLGVASPLLQDRVLYDWSGAEMTGSQHQKAAVIVRGGVVTAFIGGIDPHPLMVDDVPHNALVLPGTSPPVSWGWHDGGVRLVGGAANSAYANFADRWEEARTLPKARLLVHRPGRRIPQLVRYDPRSVGTVPPPPNTPIATPTTSASVQVLRSRFRTKLNRPWHRLSWTTAGGGELTQIYETLSKAIGAAQKYVYLEDQFLGDHPILPGAWHKPAWWLLDQAIGRGRLKSFSLFPHLAGALRRGVKVIAVGSGYADPGDFITGPKNRMLSPQFEELAEVNSASLAVWRIEQVTVHTKLFIIDDVFAAIGSANLQARSMMGIDAELQAAVVSDATLVSDLRAQLWSEHLAVDYSAATGTLRTSLDDLSTALGMWRSAWGPGGGIWFAPNNPPGFTPATLQPGAPRTRVVRAFVGPGSVP
jgi:phosphatidylserine/phosphatidylglycerophosphate/cardiolipin synthase-like enzyme